MNMYALHAPYIIGSEKGEAMGLQLGMGQYSILLLATLKLDNIGIFRNNAKQ